MKANLKSCTALCVATCDYELSLNAFLTCKNHCDFSEMLILSDRPQPVPHALIATLSSIQDYSEFMLRRLGNYFNTSHALVFQWDGFVINPSLWTDEFLEYDYIGAPWGFHDDMNVGNGGFSLRSKKLYEALGSIDFDMRMPDGSLMPEDAFLCRGSVRPILENKFGIRFAPQNLARQFSMEYVGAGRSFGFHGFSNFPAILGEELTMHVLTQKGPSICTSVSYMKALEFADSSGMTSLLRRLIQFAAEHGKLDEIEAKFPEVNFVR